MGVRERQKSWQGLREKGGSGGGGVGTGEKGQLGPRDQRENGQNQMLK